jgi:hypothetical protein
MYVCIYTQCLVQLSRPHLNMHAFSSPVVSSVCDSDTSNSIFDMFVLSQCDQLIVTHHSTFSTVASSLGLHRPVVVGAALNEDLGQGRRIWRARHYDYSYHHYSDEDRAWKRVTPARSWRQISRFLAFGQSGDDEILKCAGEDFRQHLIGTEDVFDEVLH